QLELLPRARARDRVGRARREGRALPFLVARPAADAGAADAGALRNLAIGERRLLDQAAHLRHALVRMRPALAARTRRRAGRIIGPDTQANDGGEEGVPHEGNISLDTEWGKGPAVVIAGLDPAIHPKANFLL